ncbi:hypothetical protein D3C85_1689040 [compost metagenome]
MHCSHLPSKYTSRTDLTTSATEVFTRSIGGGESMRPMAVTPNETNAGAKSSELTPNSCLCAA